MLKRDYKISLRDIAINLNINRESVRKIYNKDKVIEFWERQVSSLTTYDEAFLRLFNSYIPYKDILSLIKKINPEGSKKLSY